MRFMMMLRAKEPNERAQLQPSLTAAMTKYSGELVKAGLLLEQGGLHGSDRGALVMVNAGEVSVKEGPFGETKELVFGYAIIQAASKDEAILHGKRFMFLHQAFFGSAYEGMVEIRQLVGPEEHGLLP